MALPPTRESFKITDADAMTFGDFQVRSPEWMGQFWEECRALYSGGPRLLANPEVMKRLFPAHGAENGKIYDERKARAHYYPYPGTICDHLLAGLGTDPLTLTFSETDPDTGAVSLDARAEWWERWVTDVTDEAERPADYGLEDEDLEDDDEGGRSLHHFVVDALREALQTRTAWVLVDLPRVDDTLEVDSKLAEERAGLVADPYLCIVPAEQVIDWQCDARGKLEWAIVMTCESLRPSPKDRRSMIRHTYVVWNRERWLKYQIDYNPANVPPLETPMAPIDGAPHAFGRVPLERLALPEGLYAMGKLHSIAREHFNKRNAMSWAEFKSLYAVLYEFNAPEDKGGLPIAMAQQDASRSTSQIRGQGFTQLRGHEDDARYVGPDVAPFKEARESCNDAMREMHRVMFSMALSANMDNKALQRSGESKEKDNATTAVLLDALGTICRRFVRRLLVLAGLGRGEAPPPSTLSGGEQFDVVGTTDAIAEAVEFFNGVPQKSATATKLILARLYFKILGDGISQEQREAVLKEIEEQCSAEQLLLESGVMDGIAGNTNGAPGVPGEEPEPDDDGGEAPMPKPAPKGKRPMYDSKRGKKKR